MLSTAPFLTTCAQTTLERFVLLVDDHAPSLERLRWVVEMAGRHCVTISSAPDALVYCDDRRPDLVVTDLDMPRLNGVGLARGIKARYPSVPILLVTGEVLDPPTLKTLCLTFAAVLRKPLDVERFLALLDEFLPPEPEADDTRQA